MNLCLLVTQYEPAGAQKIAIGQANYLHQQGHRVMLCFFYDKTGQLPTLQKKLPFPVINLEGKYTGQSRLKNGLTAGRALWRLFWLLRQNQVNAIETLTHYSNVLGIPIAWLANVPVRVASQRNSLPDFPSWFHRLDSWLVNSRLVTKMVAVSAETRRFCLEVEGMKPEKVMVISNGIDPAGYAPPENQQVSRLQATFNLPPWANVVTTIARLHPQKGHTFLIQAAPAILEENPQTIFLLVGDGPLRQSLGQQIEQAGLTQSFRLVGWQEEIAAILSLSDLLVLPSLYEGMANVVLEAMSGRVAVVATDVDGTSEMVADGQTGLLVPPGNVPALAGAVKQLLADPGRRRAMGAAGYQRVVDCFSEQTMYRQYEQLLNEAYGQSQ